MEEFLQNINISPQQKLILLFSKCDLLSPHLQEKIKSFILPEKISSYLCISKENIAALHEKLSNLYDSLLKKDHFKTEPILISTRQKDKAIQALLCLNEAKSLIDTQDFPEKIASSINFVKNNLDDIVGEISLDNIYEKIFSTFCIGK
ncbi:MAG: hypothetical protein K2X39_07100 [Silvanigrellaceae bacterium]|nr:hypothetical protein [Silvanigrellaceae bacterium]